MAIEEKFSEMSAQQLTNLRENAVRLAGAGGRQQAEAVRLLPLIDAAIAERRPPPPVRAKRVSKKAS